MPTLPLHSIADRPLPIPGADPWYADPEDPALSVMTDFRERSSVTVSEHAKIDDALDHMKHNGVRCAFAVDDARHVVVGLITAYDITSEKPMRFMQATESRRSEVRVRDIMQGVGEWRVANVEEIATLNVAAVAQLFDRTQLTHIPVMEHAEGGHPRLRGLLSGAKVKRLLSR